MTAQTILGVNILSIFLTGAAGFLGGKLMRNLLIDTDHDLYILVRNIDRANQLIEGFTNDEQNRIHILQGDITDPKLWINRKPNEILKGKSKHLLSYCCFSEV